MKINNLQTRIFRETGNLSCIALGAVMVIGCSDNAKCGDIGREFEFSKGISFDEVGVYKDCLFLRAGPRSTFDELTGKTSSSCSIPVLPGILLCQFRTAAELEEYHRKITWDQKIVCKSAQREIYDVITCDSPWYSGIVMELMESRWIKSTGH